MVAKSDAEAEDIAQEAFVRAIRALPNWTSKGGGLEPWLWRIVQNTARDFGRAAHRRQLLMERITLFFKSEEPGWPNIDSQLDTWDLLAAIRSLPANHRVLIAMRYGADLDYSAIGRNMGTSAMAGRAATRRALSALRRQLERTGAI
jgi:RNA polymerase sigma-70 factor (ECF subfamily)